ncbi:FHAD1 protein, partial [Podilymbus podiceps]|nr:FHAD1 protein [Podilymbus podiceps]
QDEQLKTVQEENELQRGKLREELGEYKEQIKQHSLTIVALEDRLLEAKQQQKTLEEENAALICTEMFPRKLREELAAAQSTLLSKEAVIVGLTKELAETRARMSDMRGELSEEQKVELERTLSREKRQERELNLLREKLAQMSGLVEKKDRALKAAAEELRCTPLCPAALQKLLCRFPAAAGLSSCGARCRLGKNQPRCFFQEPAWDLADLGAKCRGLRHEETIRRQKEGLAELRERVKVLEKRPSSAVTIQGSEPLVVLMKDLPEKPAQRTGLEKDPTPAAQPEGRQSVGSLSAQVSGHITNGGSRGTTDGAASWETADATDLGEKMYLDVIGALGSLMKVKELSGMQSLKLLPQEEREEVALKRRKDLELLYDKIRTLKIRLERKEEMQKGYEASVEQLRLNQASLQRCWEEMSRWEDEAYREAEEKALLKEALERTQLQLSREKLLRAAKLHKV